MNPEENIIERVQQYLSEEMTPDERQNFEREIEKDLALQKELHIQQELIYAIRRHAIAEQLRLLESQIYLSEKNIGAQPASNTSREVRTTNIISLRTRLVRVLSVAASIAAVLLLGFWLAPLLQNYFADQPVVANFQPSLEFRSPIKGLEVAPQILQLEAEKGKIFQLPSGTTIQVPPNAFVNAKGKLVSGSVYLTYREFHNGLELLASGVPLENLGKRQESVGLFEIKGYDQRQQALSLVKNINVQLASFVREKNYEQHYLTHYHVEEPNGSPVVQWHSTSFVSELVPNLNKSKFFDSLRAAYYAQAEAYARTSYEKQQSELKHQALHGWQIKALKSDVITDWLNQQGMEYAGLYPQQEDPQHIKWVLAATWQRAHATPASYVPFSRVELSTQDVLAKIIFTPDGKNLLIQYNNRALLYHSDGSFIAEIPLQNTLFTANSEYVIGLSINGELACYRVADGKFVTKYGELIAVNSREYDFRSNINKVMTTHHIGQVVQYDVSLNSKRVVTVHNDETAALWDISGKLISKRKGLPKSWFTEVMFTNYDGSEMIGKMHDETIVYLNAQWQITGRAKSFDRPAQYYPEQKWSLSLHKESVPHPTIDPRSINNLTDVYYERVPQNFFYVSYKQDHRWQPIDTLYQSSGTPSSYAISPDGQYVAMIISHIHHRPELLMWQKVGREKQVYRMALSGGASFEYTDNNSMVKLLQATRARFYTYVQVGTRQQESKKQAPTYEQLLQNYLNAANQKLQLMRKQYAHQADYLRVFQVSQFGVYSASRPFSESPAVCKNLQLFAESTTASDSVELFQLAGAKRNVVLPLGKFSFQNPTNIAFDASGGHLIGVMPDNTVLLLPAREFEAWLYQYRNEESRNNLTILMKKINQADISFAKIRKILEEV
ncbi:MAG: WD40 repeat domain-containing protein [Cytophagales bacterium]|nr:WD40 repeat domain-containing protein [Bernardetiaceae bacterium]MDW8205165.1 WD40 repeat domain-containing protein [Cytophagales bacterium]